MAQTAHASMRSMRFHVHVLLDMKALLVTVGIGEFPCDDTCTMYVRINKRAHILFRFFSQIIYMYQTCICAPGRLTYIIGETVLFSWIECQINCIKIYLMLMKR